MNNIIKFKDSNFENVIRNILNKFIGDIHQKDLLKIYRLNLSCRNIKSIEGISCFINLQELNCANNHLTELDISKNIRLQYLDCSSNHLSSLDISNNINIQYLDFSNNKIPYINIGNIFTLQEFYCANNHLTELDISKNIRLQYLDCSSNHLSSLDISNNINNLQDLVFFNNNKNLKIIKENNI